VTDLAAARIAILGLGLMGGSLAAALSGRCAQIIAFDPDSSALEIAFERGWINKQAHQASEAVQTADLVILAAPVRVILKQLQELTFEFPPGCVVMDLGSTKSAICERMAALPAGVHPIGGHPMCGKELSGIAAADAGLFEGQTFILTPLERTPPQAISLALELVNMVKAHPLILSADENDHLAAYASHLPFLLAAGLVQTVRQAANADPRLWQVTSSGYRDTSRLAASNVNMMTDILLTNRPEVLQALERYQANLQELGKLIQSGNENDLREFLTGVQRSRKEWKR
jgi:prephenate dehydrogenase